MSAAAKTLPVAICGATGRMGRRLLRLIAEAGDLALAGALVAPDDPRLGEDAGEAAGLPPAGLSLVGEPARALAGAAVLVDFSTPEGTLRACEAARARRLPAVVCTTGLDGDALAAVRRLAEVAPVVLAPNTSLGIQVLLGLVAQAVRALGAGYDAEVVELHHRGKADAPSGTAWALLRAIAGELAPESPPEDIAVLSRQGRIGPRPPGTVGVQAMRGGDAVGEHTVLLLGDGERLELTHRCTDRDVFARGALRAARWAAEPGRAPGLYGMADVLGLSRAGA